MDTCAVLRCGEPGVVTGPLAETSELSRSTTVTVCSAHRREIDEGRDWRWDWEERRVLMDPDDLTADGAWLLARSAVTLQNTDALARSSQPGHRHRVGLWLRRWGSVEEVDFLLMLDRADLELLRDVLTQHLDEHS